MPRDAESRETALDRSDSALSYSHYETIDACDNNKRVQLIKEIERSNGMLGNEKFISKAPEAKVNEENGSEENSVAAATPLAD